MRARAFCTPDAGQIFVDGEEVTQPARRARAKPCCSKFGMLFQGAALFDCLPVWENVAFGLIQGRGMAAAQGAGHRHRKARQGRAWRRMSAMLSPAELSGGMQKRVGLARAIAADPEIIFFDEPTTGLDPIMADVINDLIVRRVKDLGATALSITHDMASARARSPTASPCSTRARSSGTARRREIDNSGNAYVDQFIHGRAEGPIQMEVLKASSHAPAVWCKPPEMEVLKARI